MKISDVEKRVNASYNTIKRFIQKNDTYNEVIDNVLHATDSGIEQLEKEYGIRSELLSDDNIDFYKNQILFLRQQLEENKHYSQAFIKQIESKDFKDYERIVLEAIRENLLLDGATDEMVEKYFDKIKQIIYLPTSSRPVISQMNDIIVTFTWWIEDSTVEEVNRKLNDYPMLTLPKIYSGISMMDELNNL